MGLFEKMIRSILIVSILALASARANAASDRVAEFAVTICDAEEGIIELCLNVIVEPSWHIYGRTGGPAGQEALKIEMRQAAGLEPMTEWIGTKPAIIHEGREIEIYAGEHRFRRKFKLSAATGERKVIVRVTYQACKSDMCLPAETAEVSVVVRCPDKKAGCH